MSDFLIETIDELILQTNRMCTEPRSSSDASAEAGKPPPLDAILVVDDDPDVCLITAEMLRKQGYCVAQTSDPQEALRIAKGPGPLDLLITDVVMPLMSGRELAEGIRPLRPSVKVLFMSGYVSSYEVVEVLAPGTSLIIKPFSPTDLERRVREVLDRHSPFARSGPRRARP